jgi:hypothetical protein
LAEISSLIITSTNRDVCVCVCVYGHDGHHGNRGCHDHCDFDCDRLIEAAVLLWITLQLN